MEFSAPKLLYLLVQPYLQDALKKWGHHNIPTTHSKIKENYQRLDFYVEKEFFVPLDKLFVFVADISQRLEGMMDWSKSSLYHSFIYEEAEDTLRHEAPCN